ncbi:hypothetical protein SADUNF_Sadunf06G0162400 [Salix dunnii]|uniref:Uncharacterized protein n=1 Tax=Salix dunnii TaxID=1413687 RepID=A0A835K545_9ROSI|nr:hypothetical protein SADUNF_Sadunf06G0162400 [Salix dunnii]
MFLLLSLKSDLMARPWVLVFLLLLILFTSQIEWKQQSGYEIEASPNISQKDHHHQHSSKRQDVVKEKYAFDLLDSHKCSLFVYAPNVGLLANSLCATLSLLQIIISQEKNIQKLNELVQSLQEQLQRCRSENYVLNSTAMPLTEHLNELKQQPILED